VIGGKGLRIVRGWPAQYASLVKTGIWAGGHQGQAFHAWSVAGFGRHVVKENLPLCLSLDLALLDPSRRTDFMRGLVQRAHG
jgi:hypothetical protein